MANKVMSLHDAVEKYVHDNDVLCFGGFTTNRKPYAAVYEILRPVSYTHLDVYKRQPISRHTVFLGEWAIRFFLWEWMTAASGYRSWSGFLHPQPM